MNALKKALYDSSVNLNLSGTARSVGTKRIGEWIKSIAKSCNYRCIPEYPAGFLCETTRRAYIDFVCTERPGFGRGGLVAIEVDSSDKQRSLQKLIEMKHKGFDVLWVRWKYLNRLTPVEGVDILALE